MIRKIALVAPAIGIATAGGTPQEKINAAIGLYTGYDLNSRTFDPSKLLQGWGPYIGANIMTRAVPAITKLINGLV